MSERYGRKNVVSAYVHMDEIGQTPHMHFCFVPVEKLEDGIEKLNAKAVVDRNELRQFHPALQKAIDESLGYHVSITSGITKEQGGNKTVWSGCHCRVHLYAAFSFRARCYALRGLQMLSSPRVRSQRVSASAA